MYNDYTMLDEIRISAPAKVNIGLYVSPIRSDGFHNISSIFTSIPLYDDLTVSLLGDSDVCNVQCKFVSSSASFDVSFPEKNTLSSTYKAFSALTGFHSGINVSVLKRIPMGGGLGGGSSDAAFLLYALEKLSGISLKMQERYAIAEKVGSDVFFFLHCWEKRFCSAFVSGRGEIVNEIEPRSDIYFVVVCPEVHSSTKDAYGAVDEWYRLGKIGLENEVTKERLSLMYASAVCEWKFCNTFSPVLMEKFSEIRMALEDLKKSGAVFADMSGSGASLFGVFDSAESARIAWNELRRKWNCYVLA